MKHILLFCLLFFSGSGKAIELTFQNFSDYTHTVGVTNQLQLTLPPGSSLITTEFNDEEIEIFSTNGLLATIDLSSTPFDPSLDLRSTILIGSTVVISDVSQMPIFWFWRGFNLAALFALYQLALWVTRRLNTSTLSSS